ncbi:MAG: oxaloacetate decarboxylase [Ruminococcaceae bacterium]|nr:oxaloacetate decarboxylase [Oscillospiraceae bacterium]
MSNAFVCILGIGTVFAGLICIIILCKLMSLVCGLFPEKKQEAAPKAPAANSTAIANKQEIVAAVCAAIAEDIGTDVKNIRVVSFKKA